MMRIIIVIPPKDFKDESISEITSMFKKWKVEYVFSSSIIGKCYGYHGAEVVSTTKYSDIASEDFDGMILINGPGFEEYKLYDSRIILDLFRHFNEKGKLIACIGNTIKALAKANIITNKKIAFVKDPETVRFAKLFRGIVTENLLESDGNIITATNSEKAAEFSKLIVEQLGII